MRPARIVKDAITADVGAAGAAVYTQQLNDVAEHLPCAVLTVAAGYTPDERSGVVVTLAVDTYADDRLAAEELGWTVRSALLAAAGRHAVRTVRTLSVPTQVPLDGQPADLARFTATYTVSLPLT